MYPWMLVTPFGFSIDMSFWQELLSLPVNDQIKAIFALAGWVVVALVLFYGGEGVWVKYRQHAKFMKNWQWALLAVDIPPLFIQTPKAVEQIFAHLSGAEVSINIVEKYWRGKRQKWFSFEIISIEGYTQFLIRTEAEYRDLVEAAIYAQYSDAEITEVEDYVTSVPTHFPDAEYDMFGFEYGLAAIDAYPIRTYPYFEYKISKDEVFSDPMAALLENFSRIAHGENVWLQITIQPTGNKWKEKGIELVKKIVANKKEKKSEPIFGKIFNVIIDEASNVWNWNFEPKEETVKKKEEPVGKVMDLTPGNKETVQMIEEKIAKIGFKTKIRALYVARKEVFNPARCMDGITGALNQFHTINRNALVPKIVTRAYYAWSDYRLGLIKSKFMRGYKKRRLKTGHVPFILNIEELATIWHFPLPFVKTPLLQKAGAKKAEPPIGLPVEVMESPLKKKGGGPPAPALPPEPPAPEELPYA